jgi:hypothetical protein
MRTETAAEGTTPLAPWGRWDRASLWLILVLASLYTLVVTAFITASLVSSLSAGTQHLTLAVQGDTLPAEADSGSARILDGGYDTASIEVGGLTGGTTALLTTGQVIMGIAQVLVGLSFVYLAWRLLRARPFLKSLTTAFLVAGCALALGGIVAQGLIGIGEWQAIAELGSDLGNEASFWPFVLTLRPEPVIFGFGLLIVGSAFEYGQRLTRATDGLV